MLDLLDTTADEEPHLAQTIDPVMQALAAAILRWVEESERSPLAV